MINKLTFQNYRIFRDRQILELKPLTVIFGKNNSGKSAVLKLPMLVENSLNHESAELFAKRTREEEALFTSLRDVVYRTANNRVEVAVDDDDHKLHLHYSFFVDSTKEVQSRMEQWELSGEGWRRELQWEEDDTYRLDNGTEARITFKGGVPQQVLSLDEKAQLRLIGNQKVDYIGPIRVLPPRDMRISDLAEMSGAAGENTYQVLLNEAKQLSQPILGQVSKWYADNFEGWTVEVDKSRAPVYNINLVKDTLRTNLLDTGLGIIQSMPIVIRACRPCMSPTLIELEEPETHLHPAAHANLGELIARSVIADSNKHYLIETHSQNLILRIRRLIAEGTLRQENVRLYYVEFDRDRNSSRLSPVTIHEDGSMDGNEWPTGVFEEALDEVIAINSARQSH